MSDEKKPADIADLLNLIQCLQDNYSKLKERYVKVLDLNEKVIAKQKTEIERLTEENKKLVEEIDLEVDLQTKRKRQIITESQEFIDELANKNAELQKQVEELTEEFNSKTKEFELTEKALIKNVSENVELQKQVDELKRKICELVADKCNLVIKEKQAVKDTAKKCKQIVKTRLYPNNEWVDRLFEEEFGAEVDFIDGKDKLSTRKLTTFKERVEMNEQSLINEDTEALKELRDSSMCSVETAVAIEEILKERQSVEVE